MGKGVWGLGSARGGPRDWWQGRHGRAEVELGLPRAAIWAPFRFPVASQVLSGVEC
jgi:hypothetical protein